MAPTGRTASLTRSREWWVSSTDRVAPTLIGMDAPLDSARALGSIFALFVALAASGCAPSEQEILDAFDEHLAENGSCEVDADCGVVYPGCPLGCFRAVRADRVEETDAYAEDLIADYQRGGRSCVYDCPTHDAPYCDEGRCAVDAAF